MAGTGRSRRGGQPRKHGTLRTELEQARAAARGFADTNRRLAHSYLTARESLFTVVQLVAERRLLRRALAELHREHEAMPKHGYCAVAARAREALARTGDGAAGERAEG